MKIKNLCILLAHSDVHPVENLVFGHSICDLMDPPQVFRSAFPNPNPTSPEALRAGAADFVDQVERSAGPARCPEDDEVLVSKTLDEVGVFSGPIVARRTLDKEFGKGKWRPLPRFVILQPPNSKYRLIDNGRSGGHNDAMRSLRRFWTVSG